MHGNQKSTTSNSDPKTVISKVATENCSSAQLSPMGEQQDSGMEMEQTQHVQEPKTNVQGMQRQAKCWVHLGGSARK